MHESYIDITSRIEEPPTWFDENGVPRYGKFTPHRCPNIYNNVIVLFEIACQDCGRRFSVEMSGERPMKGWKPEYDHFYHPLVVTSELHYGDPPAHGCVGDTMNCLDIRVLAVYKRTRRMDWRRQRKLEILLSDYPDV